MKVSELYAPQGPFVGADVYIIGTGPSMSVFPIATLEDKTCFLLNDACRQFTTLKPVAFSNNLSFLKFCTLPYQIVKGRLRFDPHPERDDNHCPWDDPARYVFSYREPTIITGKGERISTGDKLSHFDERTLWRDPNFYWNVRGGSVAIFAIQFALYAGVRSITLAGCDCTSVHGNHYVKTKTRNAHYHDYPQYAAGLMRMWKECQVRGVPLMSLTPFLGLGYHDKQFSEMMQWLDERKEVANG